MATSRRRFLHTSLASSTLVAMGATTIPTFLGRSAQAARQGQAERADPGGRAAPGRQRRLEHRRAARDRRLQPRPPDLANRLGAAPQDHRRDRPAPGDGRHGKLLEKGRLAIVQGVGYPNPDRSHFRSMEIWETARLGERRQGTRDRLAGPCPRPEGPQAGRGPARPARRRPLAAAGAARPARRRSRRSRASRATSSSSPAPTRKSKAERSRAQSVAAADADGR